MVPRYIVDEPAILDTLALCDDGAPLSCAVIIAANRAGISPLRLRSSLGMWCALASIDIPPEAPSLSSVLLGAVAIDRAHRALVIRYDRPTDRDDAYRALMSAHPELASD